MSLKQSLSYCIAGLCLFIAGFVIAGWIESEIAALVALFGLAIIAHVVLRLTFEDSWERWKWKFNHWKGRNKRRDIFIKRQLYYWLQQNKKNVVDPDRLQMAEIQIKRRWEYIYITFICGEVGIAVGKGGKTFELIRDFLEEITDRRVCLNVKASRAWG